MASCRTEISGEDVIVRATQFFTNDRWRVQSQSTRVATFVGRPKIPVGLILLMVVAFCFFVVPGFLVYLLIIRRVSRLQNIVVTVTPLPRGADLIITYPKQSAKLARLFIDSLPAAPVSAPLLIEAQGSLNPSPN
ncbi:MAG TPA: hypothetical protein VGD64_16720 [Acidisarcina sp.]